MTQQRTTFTADSNEVIFYPPSSSFITDLMDLDTFPFISVSHDLFLIYFSSDSYAATHLEDIKNEITLSYHRALSILNIKGYYRSISIFLFDSAEEMKAITGVRAQGGLDYAEFDQDCFLTTAVEGRSSGMRFFTSSPSMYGDLPIPGSSSKAAQSMPTTIAGMTIPSMSSIPTWSHPKQHCLFRH
ncbi:MAG: hypothetical protein SH808_09280 [Saprospiraceae bacterium]|nr:hypothetical protein [Saprospiraceae bacterium]